MGKGKRHLKSCTATPVELGDDEREACVFWHITLFRDTLLPRGSLKCGEVRRGNVKDRFYGQKAVRTLLRSSRVSRAAPPGTQDAAIISWLLCCRIGGRIDRD
jgi:hypothetical protein